jgi:hypothetical protein
MWSAFAPRLRALLPLFGRVLFVAGVASSACAAECQAN